MSDFHSSVAYGIVVAHFFMLSFHPYTYQLYLLYWQKDYTYSFEIDSEGVVALNNSPT